MSKFDPKALLQTELKVADIATDFTPIPEGTHAIQLGAPDIKSGEKNGKVWARLEVPCKITDSNVAVEMGLSADEVIKSYYTVFLDIDQETKGLAFGVNKNVALGKLFQAAGLSDDAAIADLENCNALGKFVQKMNSETQRTRSEIVDVFPEE